MIHIDTDYRMTCITKFELVLNRRTYIQCFPLSPVCLGRLNKLNVVVSCFQEVPGTLPTVRPIQSDISTSSNCLKISDGGCVLITLPLPLQ